MSANKTYTYTLLHNHLIGMAREFRDHTLPRDETPKMELSALGAVLLAATAVEASLNYAVERSFPPTDIIKDQQPVLWLAKDRIEVEGKINERLKLLAYARGIAIDWHNDPWLSLANLFQLRNALVHYKSRPVMTSTGAIFDFEHLRPRASRLGIWEVHQRGGTWLDVFLNRDCAEWAVTTAEAILNAFDNEPWIKSLASAIELPPP